MVKSNMKMIINVQCTFGKAEMRETWDGLHLPLGIKMYYRYTYLQLL